MMIAWEGRWQLGKNQQCSAYKIQLRVVEGCNYFWSKFTPVWNFQISLLENNKNILVENSRYNDTLLLRMIAWEVRWHLGQPCQGAPLAVGVNLSLIWLNYERCPPFLPFPREILNVFVHLCTCLFVFVFTFVKMTKFSWSELPSGTWL